MDESKLRNLNLSNNEIGRLEKAFSNNEFRELFVDYLKEMQVPENRAKYEREIIELEKQQGNDVSLIKPTPHHVLKSSVDGRTKAYINFTTSDSVDPMNSVPAVKDSLSGLSVSIPYSLSPMRKTRDKCNRLCEVFCVVFHPSTLKYAEMHEAMRRAVHETAFAAIEDSLKVRLDKVNVRTSKKLSKGPLEMTMVRKNGDKDSSSDTLTTDGVIDPESNSRTNDEYVTPAFKIKYRNEVDLQNSTMDKYCKMDILVPNQIVIEINLPLIKSIQKTELDVKSKSVELINESPKYKLFLKLPYEVNENSGTAQFDADSRVLTVLLDVIKKHTTPILKPPPLIEEISSTSAEEVSSTSTEEVSKTSTAPSTCSESSTASNNENTFLAERVKYELPQYVCNYLENTLAFTLQVKNVVSSSLEHLIFENLDGFWVKFNNLEGFFSMRITFAESCLTSTDPFKYEVDENNVFLYCHLKENSRPLEYMVGVDAHHAEKAYLNEVDALNLKFENERPQKKDFTLEVNEINAEQVVINMRPDRPTTCPVLVQQEAPIVKEELLFDNQKLTKMDFTKFCNKFRTQFVLEEESHSLSESEIITRDLIHGNETRQVNSDAENGSWITMKTETKKLRRKKKARDKNSLIEESIVEDRVAEISESANEGIDEICDSNAHSQAIDIRSAYRYSDLSGRSILKKNRSFSESSGDESFFVDFSRSYSTDGINFSSDSYSQSGPKKSVTFNDVISKKLFCSDISILEQRKRQRRHSRRKARRASDSENSETENGEASIDARRENIRAYNEILLPANGSETDLTSSLSESSGETSDDQGESLEGCEGSGIQRPPKKQQPVPSSKKAHKRRGKKSARKNASSAKHHHHDDLV